MIDRENKIVVVKRPIGGNLGGLWEFPGGKVESGESHEFALHRELMEELDLDLSSLEMALPLTPVDHSYDFAHIQLLPFLVRCRERPPLKLIEHSELRWITLEEAGGLDWAPADVPILGELSSWIAPTPKYLPQLLVNGA